MLSDLNPWGLQTFSRKTSNKIKIIHLDLLHLKSFRCMIKTGNTHFFYVFHISTHKHFREAKIKQEHR